MFAPLYSDKKNSRPNAPVNVIVGALILKELNGLTDDELLEECEFDFRYQYALHTTSYENQPLSDRTFSRFRERNAADTNWLLEGILFTTVSFLLRKTFENIWILLR